MELIVDMPISFYNRFENNVVFALAQDIDEYKDEIKGFKNRNILLDNGAWVKDGGEAMDIKEYISIIKEVKPRRAIVPDKLGDYRASMDLAIEFFKEVDYGMLTSTHWICPLQGKNFTEVLSMAVMYHTETWFNYYQDRSTPITFGLSKGTYHIQTPRREVAMFKVRQLYPTSEFHLLGYDFGPFNTNAKSMDTKWPVKKVLKDNFGDVDDYYNVDISDLNDDVVDQIYYWVSKCTAATSWIA